MNSFSLGTNTKRNLETILQSKKSASGTLVLAVKKFIKHTPIDFCVLPSGGYRTAAQQNALFKAGNSECDGYEKISKHQEGLAVDLVPWIKGKPSWHRDSCFYLSGNFVQFCEGLDLFVTSGADWDRDGNLKEGDNWDPCHFQIKEF